MTKRLGIPRAISASAIAIFLCVIPAHDIAAEAWLTFRRDAHRSGRTAEQLDAPNLRHAWTMQSHHPPQTAWHGPAKWDAYATLRGLRSMRNYDPVFHVIAADGRVYFGSSVDDSIHCIDAATGASIWVHTTDAPIRIAPTLVDGRLFFGSDDGHAYCIDASNGDLVWKFSPAPNEPSVLHNGRLISKWPVRTGVLVGEGTAYFAASMLPWKTSYLCAVDARSGKPEGEARYIKEFAEDLTFEGPLLASDQLILCPQGRVPPLLFNRKTGESLGALHEDGGGGSFVLLTDDKQVYHGPGNKGGWITASNTADRAKLATLPNANAMVVAGETAFVLTDLTLSAIDRKTQNPVWSIPASHPFEVILAGDTLFAGGDREVAAYDSTTGQRVWSSPIDGRGFGLAVSDGALYVSTNNGAIHCFRADTPEAAPMAWIDSDQTPSSNFESAPTENTNAAISRSNDDGNTPGLSSRWVFSSETTQPRDGLPPDDVNLAGGSVKDLAGDRDATILGVTRIVRVGDVEALALDGASNSALITGDLAAAKLPIEAITAAAWVRIDSTVPWGGILGALQDNAEIEHGWALCFRDKRFTWAVASEGGSKKLTYLSAPDDFQLGQWYYVAGSYDGATMRLFVNGKQVAQSTDQSGPISYPEQAFVEIGAYHDADEYFRMHGLLHQVSLYDRAVEEAELRARFVSAQDQFPTLLKLREGPVLRFISPTQAVVRWWTDVAAPSQLVLQDDGAARVYRDAAPKKEHAITINAPRRNTVYRYQIEMDADGEYFVSPEFECDTFFNYSIRPAPQIANEAPNKIVSASGVREGICVVFGAKDISLPLSIVRNSDLRVIVLDENADAIAAAREKLLDAGVYGARVAAHHVDSLSDPPIVRGFANLVVAQDDAAAKNTQDLPARISELLQPGRGVGYVRLENLAGAIDSIQDALEPRARVSVAAFDNDTLRIDRNPLDDAGEWSHQYGRADNSAFGGESLGGATGVDDLEVLWLGRPGPRAQADRNGRKPSPLATGGRLFMQGLQRLIAIDAYNGTVLWSLEIPAIGRFNIPRDASNWCADGNNIYITSGDQAWQIDAATGAIIARHAIPDGPRDDATYEWGYIGRIDNTLLGSDVQNDASFTVFWGGDAWYDAETGPATFKVCSDSLFAVDLSSGAKIWNRADGAVINSTITATGGKVYYVTCRNQDVLRAKTRRIGADDLWKDLYLVAIDAATGDRFWESPLDDIEPGKVAIYLACANNSIALVTSRNPVYGVYVFNAETGEPRWRAEMPWAADGKADHGSHLQRPAIVGERLFVRPSVFNLANGVKEEINFPWKKCGTYSCTTHAMFFRHDNISMWSNVDGKLSGWNRTRPGCWLSTIPANGLLLSPEGGGGCSCGNWLETSIVFAPMRDER